MADETTPEERILTANQKKAEAQIKESLDKIRAKTPEELRDDEARYLRARRSYLTLDDKDKFAKVLSDDYKFKDEAKKEPEMKEIPLETLKEQAKRLGLKLVIDAPSYKELQAEAKELGIKYVGVSEEVLRQKVAEAKKK